MKYLLAAVLSLVLVARGNCSPINVVVVFDGSGSMGDTFSKNHDRITKMEAAKKALIQILGQLPPNSNLGIICFSGNVNGWLVNLGPVDKNDLTKKIMSVREGGGTPLGRYMKEGANALLELRAKQKHGTYKLIIVTDGESDDDVDKPLTGQFGILAKGLKVEAIGVDMSSNHTLATKVGYRSAENADQLKNAVKAVLAESTGQNDHSEDYDLIAPLPPEIAVVALQALSEYDNAPIGQAPPGVKAIKTGSGMPGWMIALIILGVLVVVIVIGFVLFICSGD